MKKLITTMLILIVLASLCCCEIQEHTYVISKDNSVWFFNCVPEELEELATTGEFAPWIDDNYVSMDVDEEGNLVLVLNDKHIAHWKRELEDGFKAQQDAEKGDGEEYGFEYDETYTSLIYHADREVNFGVIMGIGFLFNLVGPLFA